MLSASISLLMIVAGCFQDYHHAQAVNYSFTQTNWSGGQTENVASHSANQTGWDEFSFKDPSISLVNGGSDLAFGTHDGSASIDFTTESDYIQQDSGTGTDLENGNVKLHRTDVVIDTPFSREYTDSAITLSNSNYTATFPSWWTARVNYPVTSGKVYAEFKIDSMPYGAMVGILPTLSSNYSSPSIFYYSNGYTYYPNYHSIGSTYGQGDVIGVALDMDAKVVNFYKNGVFAATVPSLPSSVYYFGGTGYQNGVTTLRNSSNAEYSVQGYNYLGASYSYSTAQSYYITSSETSQIDTSTYQHLTGVSLGETTPTNTSIKYLVSFDNRNTWKYWNGSSWQTTTISNANLQSYGMNNAALEGLSQSEWEAEGGFQPGTTQTLDFAADLKTTSASESPQLDKIQVNYSSFYSPARVDFDTEGQYLQQDAENGIDFGEGKVKLHTTSTGTSLDGATNPSTVDATNPSGTVYYSNQYDNDQYAARNVFNDSALGGTGWIISTTTGSQTGWITYDFGSPKLINKYRMAFYGFGCGSHYITSWEVKGSNDTTNGNNGNWTTLQTVTNGTNPGGTAWQPYRTFSNGTAYRYYQIKVNGADNVQWTGIQEMELIEDTRTLIAYPT